MYVGVAPLCVCAHVCACLRRDELFEVGSVTDEFADSARLQQENLGSMNCAFNR